MELNLQHLISNKEIQVIILLSALTAVTYVVKMIKDGKRNKEYKKAASALNLTEIPDVKDIAKAYGEEIAKQFPGFEKTLLSRYGGLFVSYSQGEFFRAESKEKYIMEHDPYRRRRNSYAMKSEREAIRTNEYEGVIFFLGREALPHFNIDYSILRDLYNDFGAAQGGVYAKYFNQNTLYLIVNGLPDVSICSAGNAIMFYSKAYSVKDMRQFVQNASKAAEHIININ